MYRRIGSRKSWRAGRGSPVALDSALGARRGRAPVAEEKLPASVPQERVSPYREHAPHAALVRHVECYWSIRARIGPGTTRSQRVLPDGCMDILFNLGDPPRTAHGDDVEPWVVGTMTRPLDVAYAGDLDLVGVRFRPGGARPYLAVDAAELTDGSAPLHALWGAGADEAWERLRQAPEAEARVAALDRLLLERGARFAGRADEAVLRAAEVATSGPGHTVDAMAAAAGLGRRQLERRFLASVGVPPKTASRVARFRAAVARLHADPAAELSRVAHACGYADQPHFTREFRALSGQTPGAYRRARALP